ncbi:MAG: hypoxanthine phosphoribosyltransferase [bacterium]
MIPPVQEVLISREAIAAKVRGLARAISAAYRGRELVLISILKGSIVFLADLMKELDLDVEIGFFCLSSYRGETSPQTTIQHYGIPFPDIAGRDVLLVEDIFDTGASLAYAYNECQKRGPRSLKTCVLVVKQSKERPELPPIDYRGFDIPDVFIVGYGMDYREKYRQLPYIAIPRLP